jgi:hypothetical protein
MRRGAKSARRPGRGRSRWRSSRDFAAAFPR